MKKLNIALVDDNRIDREKLSRGIYKYFSENNSEACEISCFKNGETILKNFEPEKFQIIFMDIIMNAINGIETARKIREVDNKVLIIFITTSKEFAFDTFPLHPFDYMLKPFESERLNYVLNEAVKILNNPEPFINVKISRSVYKIPLKDISAILSNNHNVEIFMTGGKNLTCCMTFREIQELLKDEPRFLDCNRGIIINMDCVKSLSKDKDFFIMKDNSQYTLHVRRRKNIIENFTQYQISRMRNFV